MGVGARANARPLSQDVLSENFWSDNFIQHQLSLPQVRQYALLQWCGQMTPRSFFYQPLAAWSYGGQRPSCSWDLLLHLNHPNHPIYLGTKGPHLGNLGSHQDNKGPLLGNQGL